MTRLLRTLLLAVLLVFLWFLLLKLFPPWDCDPPALAAKARHFLTMAWVGLFASYFVQGNIRYQLPKRIKLAGMISEGSYGNLLFS